MSELFAWEEVERNAWQDPDFLESIAARAGFAALTEGQKLSIGARLITP